MGENAIRKEQKLKEWAEMMEACANRPQGVTVQEWCSEQGLTKNAYIWRLRQLKKAGFLPTGINGRERRLACWASLVNECESRPADMTVSEWCEQRGVTASTYLYWKRCVAATKSEQKTAERQRPEYAVQKDKELQEWAGMVKECENRPRGVTITDWCQQHGMTMHEYMKRQRCVMKAKKIKSLLEVEERQQETKEQSSREKLSIKIELSPEHDDISQIVSGLDVSVRGYSIRVTETTSMELLASVLGVLQEI